MRLVHTHYAKAMSDLCIANETNVPIVSATKSSGIRVISANQAVLIIENWSRSRKLLILVYVHDWEHFGKSSVPGS